MESLVDTDEARSVGGITWGFGATGILGKDKIGLARTGCDAHRMLLQMSSCFGSGEWSQMITCGLIASPHSGSRSATRALECETRHVDQCIGEEHAIRGLPAAIAGQSLLTHCICPGRDVPVHEEPRRILEASFRRHIVKCDVDSRSVKSV